MYSMKLFCVLFLCCAFSTNVFAEMQSPTAPVSEEETNFNKNNKNFFQVFAPKPKEAVDELRLNSTLRNLFASELYQNHLFVYHQWLQFWKQWVDTYRKEINLQDIEYENISLSQGTPDLEPRSNGEDASIDLTVSLETDVSSGSLVEPGVEKIYPIYSDVDNEILFWISEKKLNQYLNQSIQTPITIMVNPKFQINTIISNSINATSGVVSPEINSNNRNDYVIYPAHITSVVSNITNITTYFVSPSQNGSEGDAFIRLLNGPMLTFNAVINPDKNDTELPTTTTQHAPASITVTPVTVRPGNTRTEFFNFTFPARTTLPVTVKPVNNGTYIDSTTPEFTIRPEIITPDPQNDDTWCPDDDDNCTESNHFTGAPFTAIYTTMEDLPPLTEIIDLNSTGPHVDNGPSTDDSNWMLDAEDLIHFNCTGDDCNNGTIGIEHNVTHPAYTENYSSSPLGLISVEQLLNSSNFNNDDSILENVDGSGEVCYCDEMEDYGDYDQYTTTEDPSINDTNFNRISENKDESEGTVFVTPKSTVDIAAYVCENTTSHQQLHNITFNLMAEDLDCPKPNNDASCDNISKGNPLVINPTFIATPESPEDLYRRHSNELIEMREIMKKLRLVGLNFLDMGHLMLNGNAKCQILPKHPEESHKHKIIYPVETHE